MATKRTPYREGYIPRAIHSDGRPILITPEHKYVMFKYGSDMRSICDEHLETYDPIQISKYFLGECIGTLQKIRDLSDIDSSELYVLCLTYRDKNYRREVVPADSQLGCTGSCHEDELENFEKTAVREMKEEIGIVCPIDSLQKSSGGNAYSFGKEYSLTTFMVDVVNCSVCEEVPSASSTKVPTPPDVKSVRAQTVIYGKKENLVSIVSRIKYRSADGADLATLSFLRLICIHDLLKITL